MAISPAFVESIKAADASAKIFAAFAAQRALSEMVPLKSVTNKALPPKQFVDSPKLEKVNESKSEDELKEKIVNLTSAKKQGKRSTKKK